MPWSAKAAELLQRQYRPTHAAAQASAEALIGALDAAGAVDGLEALKTAAAARRDNALRMARTIDGYCWSAESIEDYRIAPFHLLASEGAVHTDKPHVWHMDTLTALAGHDPILHTTGWRRVDAGDEKQRAAVVEWWLEHTRAGGEGFVVKPDGFLVKGGKGLVLAEREFKLGLEGLYRFVEKQSLAKVHECVLGVLALESEPVDPRL